ncbi:MAG: NF038122 family metalloprotease [Ignavibacteriales bacterium]|nr:NF038122 family metalloprotease [Ignavibacteriales bacterium]
MSISAIVQAQTAGENPARIDGYVQFIRTVDARGRVTCTQHMRDEAQMEKLMLNVEKSRLHIIEETIGSQNGSRMRKGAVGGFDIILRATAQLDSFPEAKQAFINAAARWEAILMNPVTVTIDVDFGPTRFGTPFSSSSVIGSTTSAIVTVSVPINQFAESLAVRNPVYADLYRSLPNALPNTSTVSNPSPAGSLCNMLAIGFKPATSNVPSIGFNSAFPFDFDPSNGIAAAKMDFDGVAVHEIGHALGFVSVIGGSNRFYTWDLFRFRPGAVTDSVSFVNAQRVLTPGPSAAGGDHVFWDGCREWELSDDAKRTAFPADQRYIGIMDPNTGYGERDTIMNSDKKALHLMGWQLQLPKTPDPPTSIKTESDYRTPTSVRLQWKNPRRIFDGSFLEDFRVLVRRDGVIIKTYDSSKREETVVLIDTNLVQYHRYSYSVGIVLKGTNDSGNTVASTISAGGSPVPGKGQIVSASSNGSTAVVSLRLPTRHDDLTSLHNLKMVKAYRNNLLPESFLDSLPLATSDTGKTIMVVDTPPSRLLNSNSYQFIFVGAASTDAEGGLTVSPSLPSGKVLTTPYTESFEVSRQSVVSDGLWDSISTVRHAGTFSLGAVNYPSNASYSAYLPQIKGRGTPVLKFWTVCRTEAGSDFGLVQISRSRGKSWQTLLTLSESSHPDWISGINTWVKYELPLTEYAFDTILVRFNLTSNGSVNKYGWLIDDIELSPVLTGVATNSAIIPDEFSMDQNFPNPFNPSTTIKYGLPISSRVSIAVYNSIGQKIAQLVDAIQRAGWQNVVWNAEVPSGLYFCRIQASGIDDPSKLFVQTMKMLVVH